MTDPTTIENEIGSRSKNIPGHTSTPGTKKVPRNTVITEIQGNVLEALAKYKFLTLKQMLEIGVWTAHYQYLRKQVSSLRDRTKPLVACNNFKVPQPRKGKVESMYYLTKKWKDALIHELQIPEEDIKIPIGKTVAYKDYLHRKNTIDFQIQLEKRSSTIGLEVSQFDTYFDKVGNNRVAKNLKAKTKIIIREDEYFIPDAVFRLRHQNESEKFFLFEMYNGKDTSYIIRQLHKHARALVAKSTHKQFNLDESKSYTILLLFQFEWIYKALIERVQRNEWEFAYVQKYFLCKTLKDIGNGDLSQNRRTLWNETVNIFRQ